MLSAFSRHFVFLTSCDVGTLTPLPSFLLFHLLSPTPHTSLPADLPSSPFLFPIPLPLLLLRHIPFPCPSPIPPFHILSLSLPLLYFKNLLFAPLPVLSSLSTSLFSSCDLSFSPFHHPCPLHPRSASAILFFLTITVSTRVDTENGPVMRRPISGKSEKDGR